MEEGRARRRIASKLLPFERSFPPIFLFHPLNLTIRAFVVYATTLET